MLRKNADDPLLTHILENLLGFSLLEWAKPVSI